MLDDDEAPVVPAPMWLPFGLLGATAAFFCVLGVALFKSDARFTSPIPGLAVGGAIGMMAGGVLRRWRGLHDRWLPPEKKRHRVALIVLLAGASIGALVSCWTGRSVRHAVAGALAGFACAAFFVPGAAFIVASATRATRARHGSIVASADGRSVWTTTLAAAALGPALAAPATALGLVSFSLGPWVQPPLVVIATGAALVALVGLALVERRARARYEAAVASLPMLEPSMIVDDRPAGSADLGVGDGAFSRVVLQDAYRGARRGEVVLRGDPAEAQAALDDARRRRGSACVLGALAFAASTMAAAGYGDLHRCGAFLPPDPNRTFEEGLDRTYEQRFFPEEAVSGRLDGP